MSDARDGDDGDAQRAEGAGDTSVDMEVTERGAARDRDGDEPRDGAPRGDDAPRADPAGGADTSVDMEVTGVRGDPQATASLDVVLPLPPTPLVVPASASASSLDLPSLARAPSTATPDVRSTKPMTTVLPLPAPTAGRVEGPAVEPAPPADARRVGAASGARVPDGPSPPASAPPVDARRVGAASGARVPDGPSPPASAPPADARRVGAASGARVPDGPSPPASAPPVDARGVGAASGARVSDGTAPPASAPPADARRVGAASGARVPAGMSPPASAPPVDARGVGAASGARVSDGTAPPASAPPTDARRVGAASGERAPDGTSPASPADARRVGAASGARAPEGAALATPALPAAVVRRVGASSGARAPAPAIEPPRGLAGGHAGPAAPDEPAPTQAAPTRAAPAVEGPRARPVDVDIARGGRRPAEPATPRGVDSQAETNVDARRPETESFDGAMASSAGGSEGGAPAERAKSEASSADAPPRTVAVSVRAPADEGLALAIPGLRLGDELGRGSQGIVYRAARVPPSPPGPDVAVKLLRPEASDEEVARFEQALVAMDALRDVPGIVQVIGRGRTPLGQPWFSMDLVRGPSMRAAITDGLLPPRALAALVADAARAVHAAHDRGIVHRDLKPENVLTQELPDGAFEARVADFGLARDLHAGATTSMDAAGTLAYMAPEQITGGEITRRTDIHALGALLHEVITGAPPFRRATHAAIARAIVHEAARAPATFWSGLPAALGPITLRALAKDPAARPQTAALLASHIERALAGESLDDLEGPVASAPRGPGALRRALDALRARSRFLRGLALGVVIGTGVGWLAGVSGWAPAVFDRRREAPGPVKRKR